MIKKPIEESSLRFAIDTADDNGVWEYVKEWRGN